MRKHEPRYRNKEAARVTREPRRDLAVFSLSIRNIPWTLPSALQLVSIQKTLYPTSSCVQGRRESLGGMFDELVAPSSL
ncbi:unnamed protein product [Lota lota]